MGHEQREGISKAFSFDASRGENTVPDVALGQIRDVERGQGSSRATRDLIILELVFPFLGGVGRRVQNLLLYLPEWKNVMAK